MLEHYRANYSTECVHSFNIGFQFVHDSEVTGLYLFLIKWTVFIGKDKSA